MSATPSCRGHRAYTPPFAGRAPVTPPSPERSRPQLAHDVAIRAPILGSGLSTEEAGGLRLPAPVGCPTALRRDCSDPSRAHRRGPSVGCLAAAASAFESGSNELPADARVESRLPPEDLASSLSSASDLGCLPAAFLNASTNVEISPTAASSPLPARVHDYARATGGTRGAERWRR
jgi:hypothetical protein